MTAKALARRSVKVAAAGFDRLRPPPGGIVILLYHRVGADSGGEVDLPTAVFERQMDHLAEHCTVIDLDHALREQDAAGLQVAGRQHLAPEE